jgi:drug/metabolite transporter (DMT)-like permease
VAAVGIGYLLYFEGLRRVTASHGTALFYLKPVLATVFAYLILGEPLSAAVLTAAGLAAVGILVVTLQRAEKGEPARDWAED